MRQNILQARVPGRRQIPRTQSELFMHARDQLLAIETVAGAASTCLEYARYQILYRRVAIRKFRMHLKIKTIRVDQAAGESLQYTTTTMDTLQTLAVNFFITRNTHKHNILR